MPKYEELVAWAGAGHVVRADPDAVAGWRIPERQKALLVTTGIPVVDSLIGTACFQEEPEPQLRTRDGRLLYRLTQNAHGSRSPALTWAFGVDPDSGAVYYVLPDGEAWFANSSIELWLRTLHHYGLHVSRSAVLNDPHGDESAAVAELGRLAVQLKAIDPPAFDGVVGYIWVEFLERWLW
ncbi:SUKH-4 family immunity protein [Streptomyces sclerotialus]|uniref:SUKH-4 family immunity protein n=1 Tax=Streptomyces sclerotialus TaxID=1957 RepID=UPI0004C80C34